MYPVSLDYQEKIKSDDRLFECKIQVDHSQGTLYLTDKDLVLDSLIFTEATQPGEEFTIGGTVASDISFTILNKPEYENIKFIGATVFVNIGLQIQEGVDAHFLQPSQPSKMKGFDEKWEYVPLGRFNIDVADRQKNTIQIKAVDNMINLDKPYSLSKLSYPATLYQIYTNICNVADIPVGTTSFPNKDYVVEVRPDDDLTLRDVLGYVAELSGTFAKCNRHGALELKWYEQTDITLSPANRFNFKPSDDVIQIKGVMATVEDKTYLTGTDDYAIDVTENPLLQGDYETVLPNIFNNVKGTVFTPYTSDWQGNPAIQAGDLIKQIDRDGKEYNTLVTKSIYKYRGKSVLEAKGLPEISRGYKGSTNRKIAEIKRKVDVEIGDKLTTLEQAQLDATELMANMLGGYFVKDEENGILYIADNPDIDKAMKVWVWGINGFAYYPNGLNNPPSSSFTANDTIVAMLVAANIITADMIQAGILQSQDGSLSLNLNNGAFSFNHGIVQFTDNGLRVMHSLSNQYSEINYDGFKRKWEYGESEYLNDIHVVTQLASDNELTSPNLIKVTLPERFYKRNNVKILLIPRDYKQYFYIPTAKNIDWNYCLKVDGIFLDSYPPYVNIYAYMKQALQYKEDRPDRIRYLNIGFDMLAIGY